VIHVVRNSWALLFGVMLLMMGNGIQGTLLGLRGEIEGFSTGEMSVVMAGYFAGLLGGSRAAPAMIRRVGHVRVFAALGSFISAALILFPVATDPIAWTLLRFIIGFAFSGVYVIAESWLNNAATNETRGQTLSVYVVIQLFGVIVAQGLVLLDDPGGFFLFILPSVLVSLAFAPILLTVSPTPAFEATRRMSLVELFHISPLSVVGMLMVGGVFSAQFGMAAVYGAKIGLSIGQLSLFISTIYLGGLLLQFPIGILSDRVDRRALITLIAAIGATAALLPLLLPGSYPVILVAGFLVGGMSNPLYALLIAYTNDYIEVEDMPGASAGLIFVNGVGAAAGPLITGWAMSVIGPVGFFAYISVMLFAMVAYAIWRATQRAAPAVEETQSYAPVLPQSTAVAVDMAQELYAEALEEAAEEGSVGTESQSSAQ